MCPPLLEQIGQLLQAFAPGFETTVSAYWGAITLIAEMNQERKHVYEAKIGSGKQQGNSFYT